MSGLSRNGEKGNSISNLSESLQINQSMAHIYHRIDEISSNNMRLQSFWDRIFPTRIQKAAQQATTKLIEEQSDTRVQAMQVMHGAQLRYLRLELEDALAKTAIEKKASGIIHLTDRRQQAEAAINAATERAIEEFVLRLQQAEKIPLPKVRELRIASLEKAMERFIELTSNEVIALDRIIEDYSSS